MMLIPAPGCPTQINRSSILLQINDRTITAAIDGIAGSWIVNDTVLIDFDGHRLEIETDRIVLDGQERARLPEGVRHIDVRYIDGQLSVTADGAPLELDSG